jgi:drug/metabolite transporter (DMT)-like permease
VAMTTVGGFGLQLIALGVLVVVFRLGEYLLGPLVEGRFPRYDSLDSARRLQLRVRAFETLACAYLCIGGIVGALAYASAGLNYVTGQSAFAQAHCLALAAFYTFHLWRMAVAKGYPRTLYPHHVFMVIGLVCCLYYDVLYFYALLSAVPAGGAVVRNSRWAARISAGAVPAPPPRLAATLILLLELPAPLIGFVHLFAIGLHDGPIPAPAWALVIAPAVASTAMAAWFVAGAFREASRRTVREGA